MGDLTNSISEDHLKLIESINNRVDSIYKQLCECEELITAQNKEDSGSSDTKIMDLLDSLEIIQEAAQMIRPYNWSLKSCHQELESQMRSLEKTMELMELEMKPSNPMATE